MNTTDTHEDTVLDDPDLANEVPTQTRLAAVWHASNRAGKRVLSRSRDVLAKVAEVTRPVFPFAFRVIFGFSSLIALILVGRAIWWALASLLAASPALFWVFCGVVALQMLSFIGVINTAKVPSRVADPS